MRALARLSDHRTGRGSMPTSKESLSCPSTPHETFPQMALVAAQEPVSGRGTNITRVNPLGQEWMGRVPVAVCHGIVAQGKPTIKGRVSVVTSCITLSMWEH